MAKKHKNQQRLSPAQPQRNPDSSSQFAFNDLAAKLEVVLGENAKIESEIPEEIPQEMIEETPAAPGADAQNSITEEDSPANPPTIKPSSATASPAEVSKLLATAEKLVDEAKRNNERAKNWSARAKSLEESWIQKTKDATEDERDLKIRKAAQLEKEEKLRDKEESLLRLEADAESGFSARRSEMLAGLEEEFRKYTTRYLEHDRKIQEALKAAEDSLGDKSAKLMEEQREAEQSLRESRRSSESELRQIQWLREDLEDEKRAWKSRVEEEVRKRVTDYEFEFETLQRTSEEQRTKILAMEASQKSVGNRSAANLATEIESQRRTIESLRNQLADIPSIEERNRAKELQANNDQLIKELERISQQNQALQLRAGKASIGVAELESLRDQRAAWEVRELGYRARLEELKSDIEEYTAKVNERDVFPACSDMDRNGSLQKPATIRRISELNLNSFASDVRNLIGADGLYYRPEDIRSFIGGLAACRMHILQGISGTGKTSLPIAFAKVMGWGRDLCEVQSGWRDRNDLLGYYNTFEKKFYESAFLKALYRASCPAYENLPFFIILDEMNLSHPEHYFADFLSALEQRTDEKCVSLLTSPLAGSDGPLKLIDRGQRLSLPPNVWFIGTANQDETTKDFADKTYDRSHVMEFPRHRNQFSPERSNVPGGRISFEQLQASFNLAIQQYAGAADEVIRILDDKLRPALEELDIGWGNRLEAQLGSYVPVLVACGGNIAEGLDSVLAHKLLRKIKGRFDLTPEELVKLQSQITTHWNEHPRLKGTKPETSMELIARELRRLGNKI